jgi:SAM-dependent methyltransferase
MNRGGHSKGYEACHVRNIREGISEALRVLPNAKVFIDIGSGLGRVLLVASEFSQFDEIIGIETLNYLHEHALKNIEKSKKSGIDLILGDANSFVIKTKPSIVFLFNPFDDFILRNFLNHNINNFKSSKSVLIYVNDIHKDILRNFDLQKLYVNELRKISIWQ